MANIFEQYYDIVKKKMYVYNSHNIIIWILPDVYRKYLTCECCNVLSVRNRKRHRRLDKSRTGPYKIILL